MQRYAWMGSQSILASRRVASRRTVLLLWRSELPWEQTIGKKLKQLMADKLKEEALIEAVRGFTCLWQVSSKNYKDSRARENAWKAVASHAGKR